MSERGFITVKVGKLPGPVQEIALNGDRTVKAALEAARVTIPSGSEIRVNNVVKEKEATVKNGDIILVTKKIAGA